MVRTIEIVMGLVLLLSVVVLFAACSSSTPDSLIVGDWYNEDGDIDWSFNEGGSFQWREENAYGSYSILSDKSLEIADPYYDETEQWVWNENGGDDNWYVTKDILVIDDNVYYKDVSDIGNIELQKAS